MEKKLNPNSNTKKKQKMNNKNTTEFEFCKVCKLNHDLGRRHIYLPNHKKSLSSFLSRFSKKISDVRFLLKNPILLRTEFASQNRLWCVFCDCDIEEIDSSFACSNAINHLASTEHLKILKHFLWKYGGGMDQVDSFRFSESDLAQWEKKCRTLKSSSSEGTYSGPSKDIHNLLSSDNTDSFEKNTNVSFNFNSNGFVPLQNFTDERHQVSYGSGVANMCTSLLGTTSLPVDMHNNTCSLGMHVMESTQSNLEVHRGNQYIPIGNFSASSVGLCPSNGGTQQVGRHGNTESRNQVLQSLTRISPLQSRLSKANVHSGAPPPWFEKDQNQLNGLVRAGLHVNGIDSSKKRKSQKLNPKRVGAAWAEKRKIELEMEKRGETVNNSFDANWLPNFGRVWQSGSRKESRKEFEMEKQKSLKVDNISEAPIKIQPYISKRMRKDIDSSRDDVNGHFDGIIDDVQSLH